VIGRTLRNEGRAALVRPASTRDALLLVGAGLGRIVALDHR
jgi:hypothetical protein